MNEVCDIVTGLAFGDEGKGRTTEYLARTGKAKSVVKFSGADQTAHNVMLDKRFHHTYRQFGSATHWGTPTIMTRFMLINPQHLVVEGDALYFKSGWNPFPDLMVSENCSIVTPIHAWVNQCREIARGRNAHGSCGVGVGETRKYELFHANGTHPVMKDLTPSGFSGLKDKLEALKAYAEAEVRMEYPDSLDDLLTEYQQICGERIINIVTDAEITEFISSGYHVFEGTQGVLLDEDLGFLPHNSWTSVIPKNALQLLKEAGREGKVTGITRTYGSRHGYGPFPSELAPGLPDVFPAFDDLEKLYPELHNGTGEFQGAWRRGLLDLPLLEYGIRAAGQVDQLMLTHLDLVKPGWQVVTGYKNWNHIPTDFFGDNLVAKEQFTAELMQVSLHDAEVVSVNNVRELKGLLEDTLGVKVAFGSYGPESGKDGRF